MNKPLAILGIAVATALVGGSWVYNKIHVQACTYAPLAAQIPCTVTHLSASLNNKLIKNN